MKNYFFLYLFSFCIVPSLTAQALYDAQWVVGKNFPEKGTQINFLNMPPSIEI
jgi:hypothetical protein